MTKQEKINWLKKFISDLADTEDNIDKGIRTEQKQILNSNLYDFLDENGYNPAINIDATEAQVYLEQIESEPEPEAKTAFNDAELFVETYKDFLIGKEIDFEDREGGAGSISVIEGVENKNGNVFLNTNPVGGIFIYKETFKDFIEGKEINPTAEDYLSLILEEKIQKTSFNDAELFVKEFKDYLVGKKVTDGKGNKYKITLVKLADYPQKDVIIESDENWLELTKENFQKFIDGEEVKDDNNDWDISLILQDEPTVAKINQPDYKYYVFNKKSKKILTGWEYMEDAKWALNEITDHGDTDLVILNKRELKALDVDPDCNECWGAETSDYSIIQEAVQYGVIKGDYGQGLADNFIEQYKNNKYATVIKARLIYFLNDSNERFKNEIMNCQYENALRVSEIIERINKELLKIVKREV